MRKGQPVHAAPVQQCTPSAAPQIPPQVFQPCTRVVRAAAGPPGLRLKALVWKGRRTLASVGDAGAPLPARHDLHLDRFLHVLAAAGRVLRPAEAQLLGGACSMLLLDCCVTGVMLVEPDGCMGAGRCSGYAHPQGRARHPELHRKAFPHGACHCLDAQSDGYDTADHAARSQP